MAVFGENTIRKVRQVDACHRKGIYRSVELSSVDIEIDIPIRGGRPSMVDAPDDAPRVPGGMTIWAFEL
jgi:hypothetical protein